MTTGLLYEPRAFWSVARVNTAQPSPRRPPFTVQFPREHFLNGEKFPITLTRALIAPINYFFQRYTAPGPLGPSNFRNDGASAIERTRLVIGAPQRQYYLRSPGHTQGLSPRPSYTPNLPVGAGQSARPSSLWGISRWAFDKPMLIPKLGDLEFDLSGTVEPTGLIPGVVFPNPPRPRAYVKFEETQAGLFNGNARVQDFLLNSWGPNAQGGDPTQRPLWGYDGFGAPGQGGSAAWPRTSRFSARRYGAENPTSSGSIPVRGFTVMIDQISYDESILAQAGALIDPRSVLSPLALNIGARARMRNGGTGAYWWREGAPLALVCPTITPAQVYDLPEPITIGPGDRLDLEMTTPGPVVGQQGAIDSVYQIGVSLCGYAAIEA